MIWWWWWWWWWWWVMQCSQNYAAFAQATSKSQRHMAGQRNHHLLRRISSGRFIFAVFASLSKLDILGTYITVQGWSTDPKFGTSTGPLGPPFFPPLNHLIGRSHSYLGDMTRGSSKRRSESGGQSSRRSMKALKMERCVVAHQSPVVFTSEIAEKNLRPDWVLICTDNIFSVIT